MKNEITFDSIEFLANGILVATFNEPDGSGQNLAHFNPDGALRTTILPRPEGAQRVPDLTAQQVIGAVSLSTKQPRDLASYAIQCEAMKRAEKDPTKRLNWHEIIHFVNKARRGQ